MKDCTWNHKTIHLCTKRLLLQEKPQKQASGIGSTSANSVSWYYAHEGDNKYDTAKGISTTSKTPVIQITVYLFWTLWEYEKVEQALCFLLVGPFFVSFLSYRFRIYKPIGSLSPAIQMMSKEPPTVGELNSGSHKILVVHLSFYVTWEKDSVKVCKPSQPIWPDHTRLEEPWSQTLLHLRCHSCHLTSQSFAKPTPSC